MIPDGYTIPCKEKIVPIDAHYCDTKNNRVVAILKMGVATLTGKQPDIAEHG